MNTKSKILAMATMAAMVMRTTTDEELYYQENAIHPSTPEEQKAKQAEINRRRGLKLFTFGTNEIWAINESVAEKKFKKLLSKTT